MTSHSALLDEAVQLAQRLGAILTALNDGEPPAPRADTVDHARVDRIGRVAHLHLEVLEHQGSMTVKESRQLRREHVDGDIRSTANLFGTRDSGAILFRPVPHGQRVRDSDPVQLTAEGERLARAYRRRHGLPE
jgi:hypothetical protein